MFRELSVKYTMLLILSVSRVLTFHTACSFKYIALFSTHPDSEHTYTFILLLCTSERTYVEFLKYMYRLFYSHVIQYIKTTEAASL